MTLETAGIEDLVARVAINADCPSSGGIQLTDAPSPFDEWEPLLTYNGIKWTPTIANRHNRTCPDCPVYDECAVDVAGGDFAWCEDVIPEDYQLTNPHKIGYNTYRPKHP